MTNRAHLRIAEPMNSAKEVFTEIDGYLSIYNQKKKDASKDRTSTNLVSMVNGATQYTYYAGALAGHKDARKVIDAVLDEDSTPHDAYTLVKKLTSMQKSAIQKGDSFGSSRKSHKLEVASKGIAQVAYYDGYAVAVKMCINVLEDFQEGVDNDIALEDED